MAAAAEEAGRLLVEASAYRWHPRTRRLDELVAPITGQREVRAWFTFPGVPADNYRLDPARGGGALLDVGRYAAAAALAALGAGAVDVSGRAPPRPDRGGPDHLRRPDPSEWVGMDHGVVRTA